MVRVTFAFGIAAMLVVAALATPGSARQGHAHQSPTPTPTATPGPVLGALGEATVARPGRKRVTSKGGPIDPTVIPQDVGDFPTCPNMNTEVTDATARIVEKAALCLINKLRRQERLGALRDNPQLHLAAQRHARDMVANAYLSHVSKTGLDVADRVRRVGYLRGYPGWRIGENLAWGSGMNSTARLIVLAWLGSPGHKQNLMNRTFREAGMAVVPGAPVAMNGIAGTYTNVFASRSR